MLDPVEVISRIFSDLARFVGLIVFALSLALAVFYTVRFVSESGDSQNRFRSLIAIGICGGMMLVGAFVGFLPGMFNDFVLRPAGFDTGYREEGCDDYLKSKIVNPYGIATNADAMNDLVEEVQVEYFPDCHFSTWNPWVVDLVDQSEFHPNSGSNRCYSAGRSGGYYAGGGVSVPLHVGRVQLPGSMFSVVNGQYIPDAVTEIDEGGNLLVLFDHTNPDGTLQGNVPKSRVHCWIYYASGGVNQWFDGGY